MIMDAHVADNRGCKEKGNLAEQSAMNCLRARGNLIRDASGEQDKLNHIDFFVTDKNGDEQPVQVKSMSNEDYADYVCLEVKGTKGTGSLYATKASILMFEREDCFIIVKVAPVQKFIENNISKEMIARDLHGAIQENCLYSRRSEYGYNHLAFIHVDELLKLSSAKKLPKGEEKLGLVK